MSWISSRDANWYGFSVFRTENLCKYGNTIYAIQSTDCEKKKKKRLQKEIMTGADKLIGGNSNITLYYFHGRANVVNFIDINKT